MSIFIEIKDWCKVKQKLRSFLSELDNMISDALFHNKTKVLESMKSHIVDLEFNGEFRQYIKETLGSKEFHNNFPYSYRDFPFSIISYLEHSGVQPEENFLIQDIINTFDITNEIFIEFLIKEQWIGYFPESFIQDKIHSNKKYLELYNLTFGY